jgi:peptidoglycan/xylan/chitin deacetylase (PgdA/CDA1 family)
LIAVIKLESNHNDSNKKWKLLQDVAARRVSPSMAMEFDDGYFSSDYTNAAHIPFCGL